MQCLELAANEMQYNSWYELRASTKKILLQKDNNKKINYLEKWKLFITKIFLENYESIHFEIRDQSIKICGRKYGLLDYLNHNLTIEFMENLIKELSLTTLNYDVIYKDNYNIKFIPVYGNKLNNNYDIVVKKDNLVNFTNNKNSEISIIDGITGSGKSIYFKSYLNKEITFSEKMLNLGFNEKQIQDIKRNWSCTNIFIGGITGSGKK